MLDPHDRAKTVSRKAVLGALKLIIGAWNVVRSGLLSSSTLASLPPSSQRIALNMDTEKASSTKSTQEHQEFDPKQTMKDPNLVTWDETPRDGKEGPIADPDNPQGWSSFKKALSLGIVALSTICVACASSIAVSGRTSLGNRGKDWGCLRLSDKASLPLR